MKNIKINKLIHTNIRIVFLLFLTINFTGCTPFNLEEDPAKTRLALTKYASIADLELGVTGAFARVQLGARWTRHSITGWAGDDMTTHVASNKFQYREYDQRSVDAANGRVRAVWSDAYRAVRSTNVVFLGVDGLNFEDKATQDRLIGETYFLRAYLYTHLVRMFGRVPLVLTIDPAALPELATTEEIYIQIESDLQNAIALLPNTSDLGNVRPSSGSATAFLARLYLDWAGFPVLDNSKYALAASTAKQAIDGGHGFALVQDMNSLWSVAGRFNRESIFTIAYCQPCGGDFSNFKQGKLGLPSDSAFEGWGETFAEIRFFEDFPAGPRKDATYYKEFPLDADGAVVTDGSAPASILKWTEFRDQQNPLFKKIIGPLSEEENGWTQFVTSRSDYIMRYAELLLIYAEASGEAGTAGADAWDALNQVRRRAGLNDVSAGDGTIQDLAYTERKWELAGEYLRWNDLVRKQKVQEALGGTARDPRVSIGTVYDANGVGTPVPFTKPQNEILGSLGTDNYFSPIPPQEIAQNPNLGG